MHHSLAWGAPEFVLTREQWVPGSMDTVMDFFSDPNNLPKITPAWLNFRIQKMEPPVIQKGTLIDYRLKYLGFPYTWSTLIADWNPGHSFVDQSLRGPYILWHHTHTFEVRGKGVYLTDRVRYRLPFGPFGVLMHSLLVKNQLKQIFDYRQEQIAALLSEGVIYPDVPQSAA